MRHSPLLCFVALVLAVSTQDLAAQRAHDTAAVFVSNQCRAEIRAARHAASRMATPRATLLHGEAARCTAHGRFELRLSGARAAVIAVDSARGWYVAIAPARAAQRLAQRAAGLRPTVAQARSGQRNDALQAALLAARGQTLRIALPDDLPALHTALQSHAGLLVTNDIGSADVIVATATAQDSKATLFIIDRTRSTAVPALDLAQGTAAIDQAINWILLIARNHWLVTAMSDAAQRARSHVNIQHVPLAQRTPQDVADAWYSSCRSGQAGMALTQTAVNLPAADLLGFQSENTGPTPSYFYVLHLSADGRLTQLVPIGNASALIAPRSQQCLTVAQLAAAGSAEHFLVLSAATPIPSLTDLQGLTIPAWLFDKSDLKTSPASASLAARVLLVTTGESQ
jgi:hypothetical protein